LIINPIFKLQSNKNIFTIRKKEYENILPVVNEIVKPVEEIGFAISEISLKDSRFSSGELSRSIKQTLVIRLQKGNSNIDLSVFLPKLVDDNYIVINGRKKIPLFQLFDIPVVTDIHSASEAEMATEYVDMIQIPAFLCRQTDILIAAAKTNKIINIKKGQFLAPGAMKFAAQKVIDSGNDKIILTERGSMFGYYDLIVDYRGLIEMQELGFPVVLDITHSLQQPNQSSGITGGKPKLIETIAKAGIAVGTDGIFVETHPDPQKALSDGANMLPLFQLKDLLKKLIAIQKATRSI
jgi:2-dehydro-3-deoxyphosphooctonate aldolase (KDO 8-P synthase)